MMASTKFKGIAALVTVSFVIALIFWESLVSQVASLSSKVQNLSRPTLMTSSSSSSSLQALRIQKNLAFLSSIQFHEAKMYSQNKEDGVLDYIFDNVGTTDKYYVEFGTANGDEVNTRKLYELSGWDGLLMDGLFP